MVLEGVNSNDSQHERYVVSRGTDSEAAPRAHGAALSMPLLGLVANPRDGAPPLAQICPLRTDQMKPSYQKCMSETVVVMLQMTRTSLLVAFTK